MTIKNKSIKVLLDNISKAKVILKTQKKLNYFPEYVLMIKKEIKEMKEEIKKRKEKNTWQNQDSPWRVEDIPG